MTTQSAAAKQLNIQGNTNVLGTSGLLVRNGLIQEEENALLQRFDTRIQLYKEMGNDVTIATLLDCIKLPLLSAEFSVVPGAGETADVETAELIRKSLFNMKGQSWRSHVRDMLDAIEYGFAMGEIVLEKRDDGFLYLRNIEPRGQETLRRWEFDGNNPITFVQRDPITFAENSLPMDKLVHFAFRGRKGNPEGRSMLRSLYRPYKFKKEFEIFQAIGIERDIGGMPVMEMPEAVVQSSAEIAEIDAALRNIRMGEEQFLRTPFGWKLTAYNSGGKKFYKIDDVIETLKMDIFLRGFSQFLTLGTQNTGTQALVQGDIDFFHLSLIAIQQELLEVWNQQLVPYLLLSNGIELQPDQHPPQIVWSDPGSVDVKGLMEAFRSGVEIGAFSVSDSDEDYLRDVYDLPPRVEGEQRTVLPSNAPNVALSPEGAAQVQQAAQAALQARQQSSSSNNSPSGRASTRP